MASWLWERNRSGLHVGHAVRRSHLRRPLELLLHLDPLFSDVVVLEPHVGSEHEQLGR